MSTLPSFSALSAPERWRTVDFVSDLHLKPEEPDTCRAFEHYLLHTPADAIFLLGDIFEAWVGDDAVLPGSFEERCAQALRVAGAARDVYFMRGNRDFLVGPDFLSRCGLHDLADPTVLHCHGHFYLLTHGDWLCTDDVDYQRFRQQVRTPAWQTAFLARPLEERQIIARHMRAQSRQQQTGNSLYACTDDTLARQWLQASGAHTLINGHTHQPARHHLGEASGGQLLLQEVLSDWHLSADTRRAQVLRLTAAGLERLPPEGLPAPAPNA